MNERNRECIDQGARWLACGLNKTPLVCQPAVRLMPHHQLLRVDSHVTGYDWQAMGDDSQFLLTRGLPLPGWQMLEVAMEYDQPSVAVKLYLDTGQGFSEEESVLLPLSERGKVSKRLLYVPWGFKALRLDPQEGAGRFTLTHLRIVWLTPWFAQNLLARRLSNKHPQWHNFTEQEVLPALKQKAQEDGKHWRAVALRQYETTFERYIPGRSYTQWLQENAEPSPEQVAHRIDTLSSWPLLSIVMPVYNPRIDWLRECLDSVLAQHYPHWQLCIADDASSDPEVRRVLNDYAERDSRLRVVYRERNGHICAASNSAQGKRMKNRSTTGFVALYQ